MKTTLLSILLSVAAFGTTVPSETTIHVRLSDTIDSTRAKVGDIFVASVSEDVEVGGRTVIPKGSRATVRLVDLSKSGKFAGKTGLGVVLNDVRVGANRIAMDTSEVMRTSGSQTKNTAIKTGVGAGIGAAIGAIVGGGKGAAIGAGAGGAAGAGSQVFTGGKKVQIPTETVLSFVLHSKAIVP